MLLLMNSFRSKTNTNRLWQNRTESQGQRREERQLLS